MMRTNRHWPGLRPVLSGVFLVALSLPAGRLQAQPPVAKPTVTRSTINRSAARTGEDVTPEQEERANKLVQSAHLLHRQFKFEEAAAEYERALKEWAHPAIHFALGQIYLSLVEPHEAYRHLRQAVRHGPEPLGDGDFDKARSLLNRLESELAQLEIRCAESETTVKLNGEYWLECPGWHTQVLRSGSYVVQADKPGFKQVNHTVSLFAGKKAVVVPNMVSLADSVETYHRWHPWKPWLVAGSGALVVVAGGVLQWRASRDFANFDVDWTNACTPENESAGCKEADQLGLLALLERARVENRLAIGAFLAGGAATVAGLVLVMLNRAQQRPNPQAGTLTIENIEIVPVVSPDSVGTSIGFTF